VTVTEALKVLSIPEEIREVCRHADINAKGILLEIAKAGSVGEMHLLLEEIFDEGLDRAQLRDRRKELGTIAASNGDDDVPASKADNGRPPRPRRPFVVRFRAPDRPYSVSLSFKTDAQPETREVIAALEELVEQLKQDLESGES
jgi:hypothetical protein